MRIAEDLDDRDPPSPCNPLIYGQAEDYAVKIYDPSVPEVPEVIDSVLIQEVKLYPNPSKGTFYLEIPTVLKDNALLQVYNTIGQLLAEKTLTGNNKQEIDLSFLPKGIYVAKFHNLQMTATKKIIIE